MSTEFRDKIRSINFGAGRPARVKVDRDQDVKHVEIVGDDGGRAGFETHHPDGTWDCTMTPTPIRMET